MYASDVDRDGDLDIVSGSPYDGVAWHKNTQQGTSFSTHTITDVNGGISSIQPGDIDGDGIDDVVAGLDYDDKISWYRNDGTGAFAVGRTVQDGDVVDGISVADINKDGYDDVLSVEYPDQLPGMGETRWYENLRAQQQDGFSGGTSLSAPDGTRTQTFAHWSVAASDLDSDQDVDVVVGDRSYGHLAWYENTDGNGNLQLSQTLDDVGGGHVAMADVDLDGSPDVVMQRSRIRWVRNADGVGTLTETAEDIEVDGSVTIETSALGDFGADGDIDVVAGSQSQEVLWYDNSSPTGTFPSASVIADTDGLSSVNSNPQSVLAADLDEDGDLDVIVALYDRIVWYENLSIDATS